MREEHGCRGEGSEMLVNDDLHDVGTREREREIKLLETFFPKNKEGNKRKKNPFTPVTA